MKIITTVDELNELAESGRLNGLFRVPAEVYHQGPGLSSTGIKELLKSPAHYKAFRDGAVQEDTPALRLGRLVHMAILEPLVFNDTTFSKPKPYEPARPAHLAGMTRQTKEGKKAIGEWEATWKPEFEEAVAAWEKEREGKITLTPSEALTIASIKRAVGMSEFACKVLVGGEAEVSVYWTDEATGVLCKARADMLRENVILDLKTCSSARRSDFKAAVERYQYDVSAAHYFDGFSTVREIKHFAWIALEKDAPHAMGFYAADEETLNTGRAEVREALELFAECERTNNWPGYPEQFQNLSLGAI